MIRLRVRYGEASLAAKSVPGRRAFGVPERGPFDAPSAWLANLVLGNVEDAAVVELAMASIEIEALAPVLLCIHGAPCPIGDGTLSPALVGLGSGDRLAIGQPTQGCRAILALEGGAIETDGGFRPGRPRAPTQAGMIARLASSEWRGPVRFVPGPEADRFDIGAFEAAEFRVDPQSNRVGVRLVGPALTSSPEMASRPTAPGVIQIARGGQPIVIGPDGPTVGGYPRIGVVARCDLAKVAQARPGDLLSFKVIEVEEARRLSLTSRENAERRARQARTALGPI